MPVHRRRPRPRPSPPSSPISARARTGATRPGDRLRRCSVPVRIRPGTRCAAWRSRPGIVPWVPLSACPCVRSTRTVIPRRPAPRSPCRAGGGGTQVMVGGQALALSGEPVPASEGEAGAPAWGTASSDAGRLWSLADARGLAPEGEFEAGRSVEAEVGYGLRARAQSPAALSARAARWAREARPLPAAGGAAAMVAANAGQRSRRLTFPSDGHRRPVRLPSWRRTAAGSRCSRPRAEACAVAPGSGGQRSGARFGGMQRRASPSNFGPQVKNTFVYSQLMIMFHYS